jgi:hypothetical protein
VLVHVVGAGEQPFRNFTLGADRRDLTAGIHELVGIVGQEVEVQSVSGELRLVSASLTRSQRDVPRRLL